MFPALRQSPLLSLLKRTPPILPKFKSSKTISTFQRFPIRLAPQSILLSVHATRSFHSAIKVEKALQKELKWLDDSMHFMRTGVARKKEESSSESEEESD